MQQHDWGKSRSCLCGRQCSGDAETHRLGSPDKGVTSVHHQFTVHAVCMPTSCLAEHTCSHTAGGTICLTALPTYEMSLVMAARPCAHT